ncbi:MAG TPA: maleylpyruvate isomerase family mycothiol-dependent enzyme [Kineosporiaceae bacterium]|nr:maleylpyruvate isomerase family mycothiol-dependent enzyme [Kineosporiaceae bacterium]
MHHTLEFPDLLRLIDERSAVFRAAIAAAPSLDVQVPTCPEWTLFDLAQHIGVGRRSWAATVAAGPDATAKVQAEGVAPREREALLAWLAESTQELVDALREAGPDRGCWTWWDGSQSPRTCGAVARHQLQEIAVHTYDAQLTVGATEPLPEEVALDGAEEFLFTCCAMPVAWPYEPAVVDYHTVEGRSWRQWCGADGLRVARLSVPSSPAGEVVDVSVEGAASDLVLQFYGRLPLDSLKLDGDRRVLELLIAWDPSQ